MLLLTNIGQLVQTMAGIPARRRDLRAIECLKNAALFISGNKIIGMGEADMVMPHPIIKDAESRTMIIDCGGRVVIPGLVDAHTHPVFAEPRLVDFEKRIKGANYEEIAKAGGGIRSSIAKVRAADEQALVKSTRDVLDRMLEHGTTTVECKSGYGLSWESERKSLRAIREAAKGWPGTVSATFLGAHVVPKEFEKKRKDYVALLCQQMIPAVAKEKLAQFVDVFIEKGAFSTDEAIRIFEAAATHDLKIRAHVGQLSPAELRPLMRFQPASLDHVDHVTGADVKMLAKSGTVAVLVPGANYFLGGKSYPDARRLIDAGVAVALATDYNPGTSPMLNMQMAMSLACTQMRMSPAEAVVASTLNAAYSLGLNRAKGSIEPPKEADLAIFDCDDYREIPYWFGSNRCWMTIAKGKIAWQRDNKS
ncbi:MAG: imidazolonepropionase [Acidobacteriales bacterium]|nr:imidazolonepropionase [Terriglobales bacterium]